MKHLKLLTPIGQYQVNGKHLVVATIAGMIIGAYYLFQIQKLTGTLIPVRS